MSIMLRLMHKLGISDAQPLINAFWDRNHDPLICLVSYLQCMLPVDSDREVAICSLFLAKITRQRQSL